MRFTIVPYDGTGVDGLVVTADFQPEVCFIQRRASARRFTCKTSAMSGANAHVHGGSFAANRVTITSTGITLGTDTDVNGGAVSYYAIFLGIDTNLGVGSYTGTGVAHSETSNATAGSNPGITIVIRDGGINSSWIARYGSQGGDNSQGMLSTQLTTTDLITNLALTTFSVGTNVTVNNLNDTYYFVHLNTATNNVFEAAYTGNATDGRDIVASDPFLPTWVHVKHTGVSGIRGCHNPTGTDSTFVPVADTEQTNTIQAFNSDGFEVGSDAHANNLDDPFNYIMIKDLLAGAAAVTGPGGAAAALSPFQLPTTPYAWYKMNLNMLETYRKLRLR